MSSKHFSLPSPAWLAGLFLTALVIFFAGCNASENDTAASSPAPTASVPPPVSALRPPGPPNLSLSAATGFEGISDVANATVTKTPDGLAVHASTGDPQMLLPRLQVTGYRNWKVHVQMESPNDTSIQIFYDTSTHPQFDEAHSVRMPIQKGGNDITMEITEGDFGGNIRLDPGDSAGDYLIKLIEVIPSR